MSKNILKLYIYPVNIDDISLASMELKEVHDILKCFDAFDEIILASMERRILIAKRIKKEKNNKDPIRIIICLDQMYSRLV